MSFLSVDNTMLHITFHRHPATYEVFGRCRKCVFTETPIFLLDQPPVYPRHSHNTIPWQLPQTISRRLWCWVFYVLINICTVSMCAKRPANHRDLCWFRPERGQGAWVPPPGIHPWGLFFITIQLERTQGYYQKCPLINIKNGSSCQLSVVIEVSGYDPEFWHFSDHMHVILTSRSIKSNKDRFTVNKVHLQNSASRLWNAPVWMWQAGGGEGYGHLGHGWCPSQAHTGVRGWCWEGSCLEWSWWLLWEWPLPNTGEMWAPTYMGARWW